jgi:molecular chaperone DnaK (HSP70)
MSLSLFEGGTEPRHLHSILTLWGIRPAPAGAPQIQVHFVIQTDGGVSVTACEIIDGTLHNIAVKVENDRLSMDEITRMTTQLVRFKGTVFASCKYTN